MCRLGRVRRIPDRPASERQRTQFASRVLGEVGFSYVPVCVMKFTMLTAGVVPVLQALRHALRTVVIDKTSIRCWLGAGNQDTAGSERLLFDIYVDTGSWNEDQQIGVGLKLLNLAAGRVMFPLAAIPYVTCTREPEQEKLERAGAVNSAHQLLLGAAERTLTFTASYPLAAFDCATRGREQN